MDAARGPGSSVREWGREGCGRPGYASRRRIRLVAYGARLESVLGSRPRGFESRILRRVTSENAGSARRASPAFCRLVVVVVA
jgi:hypothetical protein